MFIVLYVFKVNNINLIIDSECNIDIFKCEQRMYVFIYSLNVKRVDRNEAKLTSSVDVSHCDFSDWWNSHS